MPDASPLLASQGVTKKYRSAEALAGVDFELRPGELVALLGPNGSGKSTLLGILGGWVASTTGSLTTLGVETNQSIPRQVRERLGVVFQTESLDPLLTSRENLELHASFFGMPPRDAKTRVQRAADEHHLDDVLDRRVGELSGGWRRRVDLCRAMLPEPDVILLDEPTAGLDPVAREMVLASLARYVQSGERGAVLSTHLSDDALRADRVTILDRGKAVAEGSASDLIGPERLVVEVESTHELPPKVAHSFEQGVGGHRAELPGEKAGQLLSDLAAAGIPFRTRTRSLEDVFRERTGRVGEGLA